MLGNIQSTIELRQVRHQWGRFPPRFSEDIRLNSSGPFHSDNECDQIQSHYLDLYKKYRGIWQVV